MYALGVTFGAPILTSLTSRMSRKTFALDYDHFIIGNSLATGASSIGILLAARVFSAFSHGVFMSIGSIIAASVVPENRRASAISIMFTGLTVATVTGVPLVRLWSTVGLETCFCRHSRGRYCCVDREQYPGPFRPAEGRTHFIP